MKQDPNQRPVLGGIYHDKSGSRFMVLKIVDDRVLLYYASGTVTSVDTKNWHQLQPQIADI
jgi:hypothetical protein